MSIETAPPAGPTLLGAPGSDEQVAHAATIAGIAGFAVGGLGLLGAAAMAVSGQQTAGYNGGLLVACSFVSVAVGVLNIRRIIPNSAYPLGFGIAAVSFAYAGHVVGPALAGAVAMLYMWFGATIVFVQRRVALAIMAWASLVYAVFLAVERGHPLPAARWVIVAGSMFAFAINANRLVSRARSLVESEHVARAESEAARARLEAANNEKTRFVARMSHELRTPLNAIIGFSEVLAQRSFGPLAPKQAEYVDDVVDSGRHLLSLVDDLLDMAKVEAGSLELDVSSVDVSRLVAVSAGLFKEQAGRHAITMVTTVDDQLGLIEADSRKLRQVIFNLLSNAVKFTPDGGRVTVSCAAGPRGVRITVEDTGPGVATKDKDAVFREFEQSDADAASPGTGLGLPLARRFIELHGGSLELEPGAVGARFVADLPRQPPPRVEPPAPPPIKPSRIILGEEDTADRRIETAGAVVEVNTWMVGMGATGILLMLIYHVDEIEQVNVGAFSLFVLIAAVFNVAYRIWPQTLAAPQIIPAVGFLTAALLPLCSYVLGPDVGQFMGVFYAWIFNGTFLFLEAGWRSFLLVVMAVGHALVLTSLTGVEAGFTRWCVTMGFSLATASIYSRFMARIQALSNADRKARAEAERLADQAAMASRHKTEFLTNMSHELRTPLNAIIGFSEVLDSGAYGPLNEKQQEYIGDVLAAGRHLLSLINDILDLAKVEAGRADLHVAPVDVERAVTDVAARFESDATARDVRLVVEMEPAIGVIDADEAKLRHGLASLISNALKFAPAGTSVVVRAGMNRDGVVITVLDAGPGIRPEFHERIFEAFSHGTDNTTPDQGSGLGLALARRYAELHGGTLRVDSSPGAGAAFAMHLPPTVGRAHAGVER